MTKATTTKQALLSKKEAASRIGKSERAFEGYQKQGLIKPSATGARSANLYSAGDVDDLALKLQQMKEEREQVMSIDRDPIPAVAGKASAPAVAAFITNIATSIIQSTGKVALTLDELVAITGLSKTLIEREVKEGHLPSLLTRGVLAPVQDIPIWLESLKRRQTTARLKQRGLLTGQGAELPGD